MTETEPTVPVCSPFDFPSSLRRLHAVYAKISVQVHVKYSPLYHSFILSFFYRVVMMSLTVKFIGDG